MGLHTNMPTPNLPLRYREDTLKWVSQATSSISFRVFKVVDIFAILSIEGVSKVLLMFPNYLFLCISSCK